MPRKKDRYNKRLELPTSAIRAKQKRITTIDGLLARDDVNGILDDLNKVKPNIQDLVVIYIDNSDGNRHFKMTEGTLQSLAVWMLETAKLDLLNNENEED